MPIGTPDPFHHCSRAQHDEPHWLCYANHGCRCLDCRRVHARQRQLRNLGHVSIRDGAVTRARLRYLCDERGAPVWWVSELTGVSRRSIARIRNTKGKQRIRSGTIDAIARGYRLVIDGTVEIPNTEQPPPPATTRDRLVLKE